MVKHTSGPLGSANQEIRAAIDAFVEGRRASRRLPSLLKRTDAMLAELETLNLLHVRRAPKSWQSELSALVIDLPFEYEPRIAQHPSPTAAIDVVFEIQRGLFRLMTRAEFEDELLEQPVDDGVRSMEAASNLTELAGRLSAWTSQRR